MLRIFFIICLFLSVHNDEPVISWNESYKLSWNDFKAQPNNRSSAVAITASGITFGFSITQTDSNKVVSFTTEVHAHFYPEQSWYKIELADHHVLGHEQLHFDITELHTRKFRQRISQLKVSNSIRSELKQLHDTINKELAQMQNKYDSETDYSRNFETQAEWKIYVETELKKLSKYKSVD
ncbi:DUF922 domain-containing protein [Flaviramulus sp. BrNp1-15]|uniref:DUF922 domain-containing protein n=1 Tax=Flaviramulus sp. BrNp1-15 TaxID=2916754 RepID=UPI001EE8F9D5|nr:DUF922 domain-containing protein [Flaviramulus sp. BrNp1-15]ULC58561.1 DUF922 domain-containing protein [Flaviramulus sp. BrNp1-15]